MSSFNRADYERVVEIARRLYQSGVTAAERRCLAVELFGMAEEVIGQQMPPLPKPQPELRLSSRGLRLPSNCREVTAGASITAMVPFPVGGKPPRRD
jgi:hypothetical protein